MKKIFKKMTGILLAASAAASAIGIQHVSASTAPTGGEPLMLVDYSEPGLTFGNNTTPPFEFTDEVKKDNNSGAHVWHEGTKSTGRYNMGNMDLSGYKYINFWAKSAGSSGQSFNMVLMRGSSQNNGYYSKTDIELTGDGWTLITIPLVSDKNSSGFTYTQKSGPADDKFAQISLIYFSSSVSLSAPIYFDSVWVSKYMPAADDNLMPIINFGDEAEINAAKYRSTRNHGKYDTKESRNGIGSYTFSYDGADTVNTIATSRYDLVDSMAYTKTNWGSHNYVNLWAKTDKPDGISFTLKVLTTTSTSDSYFTYSAALEDDSWTLLRIPLTAFKKVNGASNDSWNNIREIYFEVSKALLKQGEEYSYALYFDEMYLSKTKEFVKAEDYTVASFGVGASSDIFEPNGNNERTEISDEVVLDGSETSMKWKSGYNSTYAAGSNRYSAFTKKDWSDYTYFNVWVYSPYAADDTFQIVMMKTASLSDGTKRYQVKLNFKGWKLVSIPMDDFKNFGNDDMSWETINRMHFDTKKTDRILYFDRIWLSQEDMSDRSKLISEVDISGVPAEYTPGESINAVVDVFDTNEREVQVYIAEYDAGGTLVNVSAQSAPLADNAAKLSAGITTLAEGSCIKVFVFGRETLTPLSRAVLSTAGTQAE